MGDRTFSSSPLNPGEPLSDRLPLSPASADGISPPPPPSEAALIEKLAPAQLRAVANWMRAIASTYVHKAPPEVSHSFRAQASRLDQLARQLTPATSTVVGTVMSDQVAYLLTATGQYLRQNLSQPGETEAPTESCSEAEFRQAYHNPQFTVLLGAERLATLFKTEDSVD